MASGSFFRLLSPTPKNTAEEHMSARHLVEKLKALSSAHEAISGAQNLIKQHLDQTKQKETTLAQLKNSILTLDTEARDAQKKIDALEIELSAIQEQDGKLQKKLKTIKKQKESLALEKEIAQLARKKYDTERELEDSCQQLFSLKQQHHSIKTKINTEQDAVKTELAACAKQENALRQKLSSSEQVWIDALNNVPIEWQSKYTRMLNSVSNPIVQINNSVCGACFYTIVEKDLQRIKLGEILPCRSCYRFLYSEAHLSPLENSASQAAY